MKKIILYAAAMTAMFACNKPEVDIQTPEENPAEETVWVEFTAGVDTKAAIQAGEGSSRYVIWEEDDKVMINGAEFAVTEIKEEGRKATFGANVPVSFTEAEEYKAVYPASAVKGDKITVSGTNGVDGLVAVATSTDLSLQFEHVAALLKFQIPSDFNVTEVTISADESLIGNTDGTDGKNTVTLSGTFSTGTDYYVPVLPGNKTNLTVRFNGYLSKQWTKAVELNKGDIANMKVLPAPVESKWILKGAFDWTNGKTFYKDLNGYYVVKNMTFDSTAEVKVHNQDGKDEWLRTAANVALADNWYKLGGYDGGNGRIIKGTYDIYVDPAKYYVHFRTAGEKLTEAIPASPTVTVYLNTTTYTHLWCWNKDKSSENFTGGSWPGQESSTNETINGKTYRKWTLTSCNLGVYTNMIFTKNGASQTGEDGNTGLLMGETMFIKLESGKARFNNDI